MFFVFIIFNIKMIDSKIFNFCFSPLISTPFFQFLTSEISLRVVVIKGMLQEYFVFVFKFKTIKTIFIFSFFIALYFLSLLIVENNFYCIIITRYKIVIIFINIRLTSFSSTPASL